MYKKIKKVCDLSNLYDLCDIYLEEQPLLKYCVIKHLIFLKFLKDMDIKVDFLQWFPNFNY